MIALAHIARAARPLARAAVAATLTALAACSSHSSSVRLPYLTDVYRAPRAMQTAARAVVLIGTSGELATGSFISPNGILLTNNHVLGVGICPIEGCTAQITFNDQLHQDPPPAAQTVFVVPLAVDIGLDMAVVQTYASPGGAPLQTPDYLTLDSRDPASLLGTHVNIVGHPDGHLAKWSAGEVVDSSGEWITFSAYALPGNSGSPILDDQGHMVGILHRGPSAQDLVTGNGVDTYAIGTVSSALITAMSQPLPAAMWSVRADTTDDQVVAHQNVYRNAGIANATVNGAPKPVVDSLGAACDAALAVNDYASPDDLDAALEPCFDGESWINCSSAGSRSVVVCPTDIPAWQQRFQGAFDRIKSLNGQLALDLASYGPASLAATTTAAAVAGKSGLQMALAAANPPLDFYIAYYLASFGIYEYQGTSIIDYVRNYAKVPDYGLNAVDLTAVLVLLEVNQALSRDETLSILQNLASDPNVDLGAQLYIEDIRYHAQAIQ
jgi:hypothetical protein